MKERIPTILHHKYSLEDGHVTPQIRDIEGYRGLMVTRNAKQFRKLSPFASVLSLSALRKRPELLQQYGIVGFHIHHGTLTPKFHFLKEVHSLPMFVSFRGNDATAYPKKKQENMQHLKKLFQLADRFFPVCEHLKREIIRLGCPEEKIRVLYGGVDVDRFESRPRIVKAGKSIRFLAIGRFVEKKGFAELIRAFAEVKRRKHNVKLLLIGEGPCEAEYRQLIRKLDLENSVRIESWIDYRSIHEKYHRSHIFCAPSCTDATGNQEGIPNTLKEAMATGMPVISTTHAGIPELVEHRLSGILVPERSIDALAGAMYWIAEHPETWQDFARHARKKIETDFNMKHQIKQQKKYYDEVILRPKP